MDAEERNEARSRKWDETLLRRGVGWTFCPRGLPEPMDGYGWMALHRLKETTIHPQPDGPGQIPASVVEAESPDIWQRG